MRRISTLIVLLTITALLALSLAAPLASAKGGHHIAKPVSEH